MNPKEVACITDIGKVKDLNEDYYYLDKDNNIFIVADGMGGNKGGEVASKIAVVSLAELLHKKIQEGLQVNKEIILDSIKTTNDIIYEKSLESPQLKGMGTTLILMVLHDSNITIAHIGDSRAYLKRNKKLQKITTDHSVVEALLHQGLITEEEMRQHYLRHVITHTIGTNNSVNPDIIDIPVREGDCFFLCTDGLTEMLTDSEIESIINQNKDAKTSCAALVEYANNKGGADNVTVLMIKF